MITFVDTNGQVAVPMLAKENALIYGVFASWESFTASSEPVATHTFNGNNNYTAAETFFASWEKVCRDDSDWSVVPCGPSPAPVVPENVSARQIRLWLISNGVSLAQIETLIDNIPDQQQREFTRVEWEYAPYIERNHPMVSTFATALGLTSEQVDAGFITAATL